MLSLTDIRIILRLCFCLLISDNSYTFLYLYQDNSYTFQENTSFETTLGEDKFSDTSEEVTASDSGKGGSEDDLPTQSHGNYQLQSRPQQGKKKLIKGMATF